MPAPHYDKSSACAPSPAPPLRSASHQLEHQRHRRRLRPHWAGHHHHQPLGSKPTGDRPAHKGLTFISPPGFKTLRLAPLLDSLVRVSRRVRWITNIETHRERPLCVTRPPSETAGQTPSTATGHRQQKLAGYQSSAAFGVRPAARDERYLREK